MAYLFVHFTGESEKGEQIYFSVSRDGLHWNDLGSGPILMSDVGELGVRDPFIVRNCLDDHFYILATDLRIANGKGWEAAQFAGSTSMVVWKSEDLLEWEKPVLVKFPYIDSVGGTCLWAPETYFDKIKDAYMVYWASMIENKQRIFAAWTKDFYHYSDFLQLIEKDSHVIDTTCAEEDGIYYRFSADGVMQGITLEAGKTLDGNDFTYLRDEPMAGLKHVEGPIIQYLAELNYGDSTGKWCLYVDDIGNGCGYVPFLTDKLSSAEFVRMCEEEYDMGSRPKRHGSILQISDEEYSNVVHKFGLNM